MSLIKCYVTLLILTLDAFSTSTTISEETKYVDSAYVEQTNVTFMCSVCMCSADRLANPYEINCQDLQMETIPEWDVFLSDTQQVNNVHLQLRFNYISVVYQLKESSAVDAIYLDNNVVTGIDPFAFAFLSDLKYLSLSNNQLRSIHPNAFSPRFGTYESPLEVLDLSYNQISHLDGDIFDELRNLIELNLRGNPFGLIDSSSQMAINSLTSLTNLNLADTGLAELPAGLTHQIRYLEELNLESNRMKSVPEVLNKGERLAKLTLDRNPIFQLDKSSFKGLRSLKVLSICFMEQLQIVPSGTFCSLSGLEILKCHNNYHLRLIEVGAFNKHDKPKKLQLELSSNNLTTLNKSVFDGTEIELLDLRNNSLNCDCHLAWIQSQKMPKQFENWTRCANPYLLSGKRVSEVDFGVDVDSCEDSLTRTGQTIEEIFSLGLTMNHVMAITFLFIVIALLIALIAVVFCVMRRRISSSNDSKSTVKKSAPKSTNHNVNAISSEIRYTKLNEYHNRAFDSEYWDE